MRLAQATERRLSYALFVAASDHELGLVLLPQQRERHTVAAQLLMDAPVVRLGVGRWPRRLAE
jgi:hypothetical protein